ncbi:MAG: hypothetical protein HC804_07280 [Anaerolineae bacterium]|nr:hypothetical protein [Anaerolineae bacterium]
MTQKKASLVGTAVLLTLLFAGLLAGLMTTAQHTQAAPNNICTVNDDGAADYSTISAAILDDTCSEIQVAAGTYSENLNVQRLLIIEGAGSDLTIVDSPNNAANSLQVAYGGLMTITGMTFQNGFNGVHVLSTELYLVDVRAQHNSNRGVFVGTNATVYVQNGRIFQNAGGGLLNLNESSTLQVENSQIISNTTVAAQGGGIYNAGILTVDHSQILSNTAGSSGGGIYHAPTNTTQVMTLTNSILAYNQTFGNSGGGLFTAGQTVVQNTAFVNNYAGAFGGGVYAGNFGDTSMNFDFTNVTISGNRTQMAAAGLLVTKLDIGATMASFSFSTITNNWMIGSTGRRRVDCR